MKTLETVPYKINVPAMRIRMIRMSSSKKRIDFLMNLLTLKEAGVIYISDLIQIVKASRLQPHSWHGYVFQIETENRLFLYGKLLALAEQCGVLRISGNLRLCVNEQLERIYKNYK